MQCAAAAAMCGWRLTGHLADCLVIVQSGQAVPQSNVLVDLMSLSRIDLTIIAHESLHPFPLCEQHPPCLYQGFLQAGSWQHTVVWVCGEGSGGVSINTILDDTLPHCHGQSDPDWEVMPTNLEDQPAREKCIWQRL